MGTRLTKQSLADRLIQNGTWTAEQVEVFVDAFFAVLQEGVTNDGSVKLRGLGTFKTVQVADRASVDVNTGERIVIPGHKKLKFVEEEKVNQLLNNPELVSEPVQEPTTEQKLAEPTTEQKLVEPTKEKESIEPATESEQTPKTDSAPKGELPVQEENQLEETPPQCSCDSKWWIWGVVAFIAVLVVASIIFAVCNNDSDSQSATQTEQKSGVEAATTIQENQPQYKVHVFQKGESLTTISILHYATIDSVKRIQELNGLTDTTDIQLGTELRLP
jgi:nucleoid DNA-binding protein